MTPDNIARLAGKLLYVKTRLTMIGSTMPGIVSGIMFGEKQELEADLSLYTEIMDMVEREALANETRRVVLMMMGESETIPGNVIYEEEP